MAPVPALAGVGASANAFALLGFLLVYVGYLRKKLGKGRIVNTRGMGYRLEAEAGSRRRHQS